MTKFPESALAHKYLDGLKGIEIGGAAHNAFGLDTLNIDRTDRMDSAYKQSEREFCGEAMPIDIVAQGDALPLASESQDFVISSHVLEHFTDPIGALSEWYRVLRSGGYVFMIVPHRDRTDDSGKERTTLADLTERHMTGSCSGAGGRRCYRLWAAHYTPANPPPGWTCRETEKQHCSVWITEDVVELAKYMGLRIAEVQDVDDKVGNGFTVVVKKE